MKGNWNQRNSDRWEEKILPLCHGDSGKDRLIKSFLGVLTVTGGSEFWASGKESACNAGDAGLIPGSGRSPGGGHGNSLQYSCLENPMDRGAWRGTVHRMPKRWTQLKQLNMHACMPFIPNFSGSFYHELLNFVKHFFCIKWYNHEIFLFQSIKMVDYTN